ncbi:MAG: TraB/GumN family protein [Pseudomonadota bacterium]
MRRILTLIACLLSFPTLAHALCEGEDLIARIAANDPDTLSAMQAAAASQPNDEGLFWRIETPGAPDTPPSYLFGTFHSANTGLGDRVAAVTDAVADARLLYVEITAENQLDMQTEMQTNPALILRETPLPLDGYLSPELVEVARAALASYGMTEEIAAQLKTWFLGLILSIPACELQDLGDGTTVLDVRLQTAATAAGTPVEGLETWRSQLAIFSGSTPEEQRQMVRYALAGQADAEAQYATMRRLYAAEKPLLIWELSAHMARQATPDADKLLAEVWDILIVERNAAMAQAAAAELAKGGVFIAVGALHLGGAGGLVELIRAQGFDVTRAPL